MKDYMKKSVVKKNQTIKPESYAHFLKQVIKDIQQTQIKAALSVTQNLILLYWRIGKELSEKIKFEGWGTKVVEKLAHDLGNEFPGITGFSRTNMYRMIAFYKAYPNCPTAVGQIEDNPILALPWGHNTVILEKIQDNKQRLWYAQKTIENGWSRSVLLMWIESDLYKRQGKAITNFKATLPKPHSDLAEQVLKDPYNFDFLTIDSEAREREIEHGLMSHIQKFLLELGQGFSFVGQQYHLEVGEKDFYLDLLFYHLKLRCFIVVELKNTEFIPEHAGKLNFYLAAVDDLLRAEGDKPTIGLLLCKSKDNIIAEYALRTSKQPIGISSYTTKLVETLPKEFKGKLPTIKEIETELSKSKFSEKKRVRKKTD